MALALLVTLLTGCTSADWLIYGGFLDPTVLGSYHGPDRTLEIRTSISLNDDPGGIAGATEPIPEDTVAIVEEYHIGPGDQVIIRMLQIVAEDQETSIMRVVDNLGNIYIPVLRTWFKIEGKTERQAQLDIANLIREQQLVRDPEVDIQVVTRRSATYSVFGGLVGQQGLYEIPRPNFRLLEALNLSGGISEMADEMYVFRSMPAPERRIEPDAALGQPSSEPAGTNPIESNPFTPGMLFSAGLDGGGPPPATSRAATTGTTSKAGTTAKATTRSKPASAPVRVSKTMPAREAQKKELIQAIAPATGPRRPHAQTAPAEEGQLTKWIWLNGEWVEVRQGPASKPPATVPGKGVTPPPQSQIASPQGPQTRPDVDWEDFAEEPEQRIIRIPAKPLRDGDPRYNIVIRHGDIIRVPSGPVGEFYMGGTIARPGTYSLTGRKVTLKQAVVAAGMLNVFGWPERCELIRRTNDDREIVIQLDLRKIFEYKEDGLYLKPNDVVMVGTHAITPFLASIRNGFRLSYGFGFVYDRNFADIDSFTGQVNPASRQFFGQGTGLSQFFPSLTP